MKTHFNKPIYILGISAYYHDSAAVLLADGEIIAAAQQERFSRKKHDSGFPKEAIQFCLDAASILLEEIEYIVFYDKPFLKFERLLETYYAFAPKGFKSFATAIPVWIREKLLLKKIIRDNLNDLERGEIKGKFLFPEHHVSHAASAFYPSPYEDSAVLTVDGVGEYATTTLGRGSGNKLEILKEIHFPHSLGLLYSAFTYHTGFRVNSGEYKVMGLAPYGEPRFVDTIYKNLLEMHDDGSFSLNMKYFSFATGLKMTNSAFDQLFGKPARTPESPLTQTEMDMAASIQVVTKQVMLKLANHAFEMTKSKNLVLAGGVALNCVANGIIMREGPFENIWIQPAAGDAGGALGAALAAWYIYLDKKRQADGIHDKMCGTYFGPEFSNEQIRTRLSNFKAVGTLYSDENELFNKIAKLLDKGNVIGWMSGKMEFGPRALGARSILGDARNPEMQKKMNLKIKYRESFRPFAPSVMKEMAGDYFELKGESPYMLLVDYINPKHRLKMTEQQQQLWGIEKLNVPRSVVPAITHVDYSARIQTVDKNTSPRYWKLLSAFKNHTGHGILVNTSFNVRGEPIVCNPEDAYRCFMRTEMDYLVVENWIFAKEDQPPFNEDTDWKKTHRLD